MDLNENLIEYSKLVRAHTNISRLFRFLCIYLTPIIFFILFFTSLNIWVTLSIVLLYAYLTRVGWVFGLNRTKIYRYIYKHYEEEKKKMFK